MQVFSSLPQLGAQFASARSVTTSLAHQQLPRNDTIAVPPPTTLQVTPTEVDMDHCPNGVRGIYQSAAGGKLVCGAPL